jgi:glycosyltransferase involved in cell wall biosynthesis/Flp pilus assembly protein TadD
LLIRREVLERIGGLDEGYGISFFEDDDLCLRAREAGFKLLAAQDVFIHHFGSQTVKSLSIDARHQLQTNLERFRQKWGDERASRYRLPDQLHLPAATLSLPPAAVLGVPESETRTPKLRVSLTMIVKNEEANLPACLLSAADLFDEIVVVDTGSTDQTKEIAKQFGAKVFDFPWCDSFAAARNEGLRHASGDWIFWLDADDRLDEANRAKLKALFENLPHENVAFSVKCRCSPDGDTGVATVVDHVRLFRNRPDIRWKYRVHEQILPGVNASGARLVPADVVIEHVGYVDPNTRAGKDARNLRLLEMDYADDPNDPFSLFNLGWQYQTMNKPAEALPFIRRSLELSEPHASIVRKLYDLAVQCHRQLKQPELAMAACQAGRKLVPEDPQLLYDEGRVLHQLGRYDESETRFQELLAHAEKPLLASVAEGLHGPVTRNALAVLYYDQGRLEEAEAQWQRALKDAPHYVTARLALAELYLKTWRFEEMERVVHSANGQASHDPAWKLETSGFKARAALARRDFGAAHAMLDQALNEHPRAPGLWQIRSYALLQEGKDLAGAERALRTLIDLDPDNAEAKSNLDVLLRQLDRDGAASEIISIPAQQSASR